MEKLEKQFEAMRNAENTEAWIQAKNKARKVLTKGDTSDAMNDVFLAHVPACLRDDKKAMISVRKSLNLYPVATTKAMRDTWRDIGHHLFEMNGSSTPGQENPGHFYRHLEAMIDVCANGMATHRKLEAAAGRSRMK